MDMHEWVRVPQVLVHLLEHHSDLGHHDEDTGEHHGHESDHDPFAEDCHGEFCACSGMVALTPASSGHLLSSAMLTTTVGASTCPLALNAFSGNVWNPPKA